jgi:hypothetical protein
MAGADVAVGTIGLMVEMPATLRRRPTRLAVKARRREAGRRPARQRAGLAVAVRWSCSAPARPTAG